MAQQADQETDAIIAVVFHGSEMKSSHSCKSAKIAYVIYDLRSLLLLLILTLTLTLTLRGQHVLKSHHSIYVEYYCRHLSTGVNKINR